MGTIETIAACIGSGALGVLAMGVFAGGHVAELVGKVANATIDIHVAQKTIVAIGEDRDRASDIAGRLQLKMDAIRDLIETPRTIRKAELSAIVNGEAAA